MRRQRENSAETASDRRSFVFDRGDQTVFFIYLFFTLLLVFFHEPWEDELQAWCIARELSIPEIFHQMRYEGHFALWYLLLKPFAAFGMSLSLLNLMSWLLCVAAAGMLLGCRVFSRWMKILILFSCPMLYWFPAVARNYALIPPALCLLAALYPVRLKKPWAYAGALLLLVHSHAYMEGLAGILGALFVWDLGCRCRRMPPRAKWTALGVTVLLAVGVLAAFLQVYPAFGASSFAPGSFGQIWSDPARLPEKMLNASLRVPLEFFGTGLNLWLGKTPAALLFYLLLAAGAALLFRMRGVRAGIIFLAGFIWQILFAALIYPMAMHRVYLPFMMLIFCFALPLGGRRRKNTAAIRKGMIPAAVLAVLTLPDLLHYVSFELMLPFSNQQSIAYFIENKLPLRVPIVVFPASLITGTFRAYLPHHDFRRCTDGEPFRVFRTKGEMPESLDNEQLKKYMAGRDTVYLLFQKGAFLSYRFPPDGTELDFEDFRMKLLYSTAPKAFFNAGEDYALFEVTRKRPDSSAESATINGKEKP